MLGATSWLLPGGAERAFRGVVHAASERQWVKLQVDSELRPPLIGSGIIKSVIRSGDGHRANRAKEVVMILRTMLLTVLALLVAVAPALAKGGGGGGGGGGAAGGAGAGNSAGGHGGGNAGPQGAEPSADVSPGGGRGTALSNPGSAHRSDTATENLSTPTPGKAHPRSGVKPGRGKVGTVPTTPGHQ